MNLLNHDEGFFIWEIIIFLIFISILVKMARKPLLEFLKERQKSISDSLVAAEMLKVETEQLKKENEEKKLMIRREISDVQNSAKEYAGKIIWEAEAEAKVACKIIMDEALSYVEKLKRDAINELKNKAGKIVVDATVQILYKELSTEAEQEVHIRGLIKKINLN